MASAGTAGIQGPSHPDPPDLTLLLDRWSRGDRAALDELIPIVYAELRNLARHYLRQERPDHTLQTTALVNEAYLRLVRQRSPQWQGRGQFYAVAAQIMRRILVDHARERNAAKRGGVGARRPLDDALCIPTPDAFGIAELDGALTALAAVDAQKAQVVELRYFGGLSVEDAAEVLSVSPTTVKREWAFARAWLYRKLSGREPS